MDAAKEQKDAANDQKDVVRGQQADDVEKQRNDCDTLLARDGSSDWNWADFIPYM
jgi:hypothetical protein